MTERQQDILAKTVFEYIHTAQPVSSQWLERKYRLSVSSATIRNEMVVLTEHGFLLQPYVSAGRVPTDKGYRFFADEVKKNGEQNMRNQARLEEMLQEDIEDFFRFAQNMARQVAMLSSDVILISVPQEKFVWKEGWETIVREPEFSQHEYIVQFAKFLRDLENGIEEFPMEDTAEIFIGQENPFSKVREFSVITCAYTFPGEIQGIVAIAGPKRMHYDRNLDILQTLVELFEKNQNK